MLTKGQKGGIVALIVAAIVGGIALVKKVIAAPPPVIPEFSVGQATWDAPMPFAPDSQHVFSFQVTNLDSLAHHFKVELYFASALFGTSSGLLPPGNSREFHTNVRMPLTPGTYELAVKIWIDGVYAGESTVSKVRVAQYYQPGDANGDGEINMADVTKVERIIYGIDPPTLEADANQDGIIDWADTTKIVRIIIDLDNGLPPPDLVLVP